MEGGSQPILSARQTIAGPGSAALKYDMLTALLSLAAQGNAVEARLALRLSLLMTARFNWRQGTFAVGLRELARMWGVTERTAKREMSAMRARSWIAVSVPAARGRVAAYRIDLANVLRDTMPFWDSIGPDFAARMVGAPEAEHPTNVVPLRTGPAVLPMPDGSGWAEAAVKLRAQDPAVFDAWFAPLTVLDIDGGVLILAAPTRFQADYVRTHYKTRLLAAVSGANPGVRDVAVQTAD